VINNGNPNIRICTTFWDVPGLAELNNVVDILGKTTNESPKNIPTATEDHRPILFNLAAPT
jgi:hypothetical protein